MSQGPLFFKYEDKRWDLISISESGQIRAVLTPALKINSFLQIIMDCSLLLIDLLSEGVYTTEGNGEIIEDQDHSDALGNVLMIHKRGQRKFIQSKAWADFFKIFAQLMAKFHQSVIGSEWQAADRIPIAPALAGYPCPYMLDYMLQAPRCLRIREQIDDFRKKEINNLRQRNTNLRRSVKEQMAHSKKLKEKEPSRRNSRAMRKGSSSSTMKVDRKNERLLRQLLGDAVLQILNNKGGEKHGK